MILIIRDSKSSIEDKNRVLNNNMELYGHKIIGIAATDGKLILTSGDTIDISEREIFKETMKGNVYIADPLYK